MEFDSKGFYYGNEYMSDAQMENNALYVANAMRKKGWTDNAIAALLGNMQAESNINPGIWEGLNMGNMSGGFGLTQWTPASKFLEWNAKYSLGNYYDMDVQLLRIEREFLYPGSTSEYEQYYSTSEFSISAANFIKSTESPEWLAKAFVRNYERPASVVYGTEEEKQNTYAYRGRLGLKWYEYITNHEWEGGDTPPVDPDNPQQSKKGFNLVLWLCTRRRGYVVR